MILDILFVAIVVGILIAIYKTKFSKSKTVQQIKSQILTEQILSGVSADKKQQPRAWTGDDSSEEEDSDEEEAEGKVSMKKQLYKQQKKKEKQQRKQARQHYLTEEKQKRQEYQKQVEEKERQEQEKRLKQQEYINQMREQQRKRKQDQFNKWKNMFQVQETGLSKQSEQITKKKQAELQEQLTKYLKKKKLSQLEDASHKFRLTTKDLVEKIKKIEKQGKISGVFDQRGKYMYVEEKQWNAIKNYISAKGRMKKIDLMTQCAKIIKIPDQDEQQFAGLVDQQIQKEVK